MKISITKVVLPKRLPNVGEMFYYPTIKGPDYADCFNYIYLRITDNNMVNPPRSRCVGLKSGTVYECFNVEDEITILEQVGEWKVTPKLS